MFSKIQDIEDLGNKTCTGKVTVRRGRQTKKIIIEFSRRNDVPANDMEFAFQALLTGHARYRNPFYKYLSEDQLTEKAWVKVDFKPDDVFCVSWLSKDYKQFLEYYNDPEKRPVFDQYRHHFQFAFNSEHPHSRLEPGLEATLDERLDQLAQLCEIGKKQHQDVNLSVRVNFVPILTYKDLKTGKVYINSSHFPKLCEEVKKLGINEINISFLEPHRKVVTRTKKGGIRLFDMNRTQKMWVLERYIFPYSRKHGITLHACVANKENRDFIDGKNVSQETCLSYNRIKKIGKGELKPKGQSGKGGVNARKCSCQETRDLGSYNPPCKHGCVYCYANSKQYNDGDFEYDEDKQDIEIEDIENMTDDEDEKEDD